MKQTQSSSFILTYSHAQHLKHVHVTSHRKKVAMESAQKLNPGRVQKINLCNTKLHTKFHTVHCVFHAKVGKWTNTQISCFYSCINEANKNTFHWLYSKKILPHISRIRIVINNILIKCKTAWSKSNYQGLEVCHKGKQFIIKLTFW